uniref:RNase H type-1 domain-containing protein n=1 Tax=Noccaea caerulescens TaxID=107243 RepID=A0A1J3JN06_NOCCA
MTEALAIKSAMSQALERGFLNLQLKSDAHNLVRTLTAQEKIKEIYSLLFNINSLVSLFTSISFLFILRAENHEADTLAKNAAQEYSSLPVIIAYFQSNLRC